MFSSARSYNPIVAALETDLTYRLGPIEPVLARVDPLLASPTDLSPDEVNQLVAFVRDALTDGRATTQNFCRMISEMALSGFPGTRFEVCSQAGAPRHF